MYQQIASNKRRAVLYVALFFVVWVGIGAILGWIVSAGSSSAGSSGGVTSGDVSVGIGIAALLALAGIAFTLTSGASLVLSASGAKPADPQKYAQLHNIVEALAIGDGMPKPQVFVIEDPSPNAFATGISPDKAAITATTGLLATMNREELEGVLSHEMSHIKNYDVRLILIVSTLIGMAGLLASLIWRSAFYVRPRGRGSGDPARAVTPARVAGRRQRGRADPQPGGADLGTEEAAGQRQAVRQVQPRHGCDVHRRPVAAPRELVPSPVRHAPADRGADRGAREDRDRTVALSRPPGREVRP